jgi:hypothetical protein
MSVGFFRPDWDRLKRWFQKIANAELVYESGQSQDRCTVTGLIRTAETPEARVAIVTAIRPNEGASEPNSLDETPSCRPAH